jgi:hypothetical protein
MNPDLQHSRAEETAAVNQQPLPVSGQEEAAASQQCSLRPLGREPQPPQHSDLSSSSLELRVTGRDQLIKACDLLLGLGVDDIDIK